MSIQPFRDLIDMQKKAVMRYADRDLFGTKKGGEWSWTTFSEFGQKVDLARAGLAARGIRRGDTVCLIAGNRVEWAVLAYATYGLGARFVPMYENQPASDWRYILADAGARMLVASAPAILETLSEISIPTCCLDVPDDHPKSFARLLEEGRDRPCDTVEIDPDAVSGIIYTSGTTGNPKGVLLSHRNFISNVNACHEVFPLEPTDRTLSFLPWAHSFGQTVELHTMLSMGVQVAFAESVQKLIENLGEVRPTILISVPRIFNRIYDGLNKKMAEERGVKKFLFKVAVENEMLRKALDEQQRHFKLFDTGHRIFDRLVFNKVRQRFGGRLKYAFSGGAALSPEVAHFIDAMGIMVYEGYGLTETSPIVCANYPGNRKIGSVGKPLPGIRVKIDTSVVDDGTGDGEIVVYGPNVMQGYHNLPEETAKVMTKDGGFRTGDRGNQDPEGYVRVTGRIKEQYKLENGKYVVPAVIEERLQLSPYIAQAFIDGHNRPFNAAILVPDRDALEKFAHERGLRGEPAALLEDPAVRELFAAELERYGAALKGYERIKKFVLVAEEFTTENGMLTPSLKVKRRKVLEKYGTALEALFQKPD